MSGFFFLRHGQTDMNIRHMMQGRVNTHLNETGRRQARKAAEFMRENGIWPDEIYTSPLVRTIETAEEATGQKREVFKTEPLIVEMSFGIYEGTEVEKLHPDFYHDFFDDPVHCCMPDQAETYEDLLGRARTFYEKILRLGMSEDKTRLYVSHGAFLHALFIVVNEIPLEKMWDYPVDNASIMQLVEENGKYRLKLIFEGYGNRTGNVLEEE